MSLPYPAIEISFAIFNPFVIFPIVLFSLLRSPLLKSLAALLFVSFSSSPYGYAYLLDILACA